MLIKVKHIFHAQIKFSVKPEKKVAYLPKRMEETFFLRKQEKNKTIIMMMMTNNNNPQHCKYNYFYAAIFI
jgi:hypothetical protein